MNGSLDLCNVFVKYLPSELTESQFHELFVPFGHVISSKIMIDQTTGKSLGYGFVRFKVASEAQTAINAMNGQRISNKRLLCKLANQSANPTVNANPVVQLPFLNSQTPSSNLYIKPLLPNTSEQDLRDLFGKFGFITDCKVMVDHNTGMSRQIGFVRFERQHDANKAIEEMNGYKLANNALPLTVKYADTEEQKEARRAFRVHQQPQYNSPPSWQNHDYDANWGAQNWWNSTPLWPSFPSPPPPPPPYSYRFENHPHHPPPIPPPNSYVYPSPYPVNWSGNDPYAFYPSHHHPPQKQN
eukprot:TRINITY_DN13654_c0_g1_i1.p1 TRINITY_DN13654_c0_g1~~TRINITY_DN13654_c0_g1_i1.p1  ORF type:complete len:299 (-),score=48.08 TRINITY_DN13654_c0_g1_i1:72-968(-)